MSQFKERGTIKWNAMMIPEHKRLLSELFKEEYDRDKPELDEHALEVLNEKIREALIEGRLVRITYYHNGAFCAVQGRIKDCELPSRKLRLISEGELYHKHSIPLQEVIDVDFL
jgi:hypothetical protein